MSTTLAEELSVSKSAVIEPLTVEQYHAMIRQGILVEGAPIELIDGLLVRKDRRDREGNIMTVGPRHANTIVGIVHGLMSLLDGQAAHVRCQQPVTLDGTSEPEPDVSVVYGARSEYVHHHPGPGAIALVIEVADSSLAFDRGDKRSKYASAGIPQYWIVNLNENVVEVFSQPQPQTATYLRSTTVADGETLQLKIAETTVAVRVSDLFN
jgi:Uma2 family endonuclease